MRDVLRRVVWGMTAVVLLEAGSLSRADAQAPDAGDAPAKPPAVEANNPLLLPPQAPEETFGVILLMLDLGRTDLAKKYLDQFLEAQPDDTLLLQMRQEHGTAAFLRMSRVRELQPQSIDLLNRLNAASRAQAANPEFVNGLIDRLAGTPTQRELAISELRGLGPGAAGPLVLRLAQAEGEDLDRLKLAMTQIGGQLSEPLTAVLDSPSSELRIRVMDVLGWLRASVAVPKLWASAFVPDAHPGERQAALIALRRILTQPNQPVPMFSDVTAVAELQQRARTYLRGLGPVPRSYDGDLRLWMWDDAVGTVVERPVGEKVASLFLAAQAARDALRIGPDSKAGQELYLVSLIAYQLAAGLPLQQTKTLARGLQTELLRDSLDLAMQTNQAPTATVLIDALVEQRGEISLQAEAGKRPPLAAALNYPDPRVQFSAATAILQLDPVRGFQNADRVMQILRRALVNNPERTAILIDADEVRSSDTLGYLRDLGYHPIRVQTGKAGFRAASTTASVGLIVVDINVAEWGLRQTLANLRADARTAYIPIILYGPEKYRPELTRLLAETPGTTFVATAAATAHFDEQTRNFLAATRGETLGNEEITQQRHDALAWAKFLAVSRRPGPFDLLTLEPAIRDLADDQTLGVAAQDVLAGIPTVTAQERLANLAGTPTLSNDLRVSALRNLQLHAQRFGWSLSQEAEQRLLASLGTTDNPELAAAMTALKGSRAGTRIDPAPGLQTLPVPAIPNTVAAP